MKKVLFLGAAAPQIPPIQYAIDQGYYVITCDYLPSNPGHLLAHESHDVSTTDMEAVLELSRRLDINGIVAYAMPPVIVEVISWPSSGGEFHTQRRRAHRTRVESITPRAMVCRARWPMKRIRAR